jgi:hypothetical protein
MTLFHAAMLPLQVTGLINSLWQSGGDINASCKQTGVQTCDLRLATDDSSLLADFVVSLKVLVPGGAF